MMIESVGGQPQERPQVRPLGMKRSPRDQVKPRPNRASPDAGIASPRPNTAVPMPKAEPATPSAVRGALESRATKAANKKMGPEMSQEKAMKMPPKARKQAGKRYDRELKQQRLKSWTT